MESLQVGDPDHIGAYALARRLGSGGQGVVYEGYGPVGERVAVKVLRSDSNLRRPFAKEVAAAKRVAAFCTARILADGIDGGRPYIVTEFVDGPSLHRAVIDTGPFTGDALRRLATGIATAMAAVHDAGVAHCDLKPDNVLLGPDGPRVIDFGIARIFEQSLTASRGLIGTPAYLAPELYNGAEPGPAADVFAWGAVMVFAATGTQPFYREHMAAVMHGVLAAEVDLSALDEPLRALVGSALAKDPAHRPSARQLLFGLLGGGQEEGMLLDAGTRAAASPSPGIGTPSLGQRAEHVFGTLGPAEQAAAAQVLLRSVRPAGGGYDLVPVEPDEVDDTLLPALPALTGGGILRRQDSGVMLTGTALIQAWSRLRAMVADEHEGLPIYQNLRAAARNWHVHGRRDSDLYRGAALESATAWAATDRRHLELNQLERQFLTLAASQARRSARRRQILSGTLAVLLVAALGLGGLAEVNRREAQAQRRSAQQAAHTIAAQRDEAVARRFMDRADAVRDSDPAAALLLSAASAQVAPVADARLALLGSLAQSQVVRRSAPSVRGVGDDGRTALEVSGATVRLTDVVTGARVATIEGIAGDVTAVRLSADRTRLAVVTRCGQPCGDAHSVQLWQVSTGKPLGHPLPLNTTDDFRSDMLRFDGDGRLMRNAACGQPALVAGKPGGLSGCVTDHGFGLADPRTGRVLTSRSMSDSYQAVLAQLSPDGTRLAVHWTLIKDSEEARGFDLWQVRGTRIVTRLASAVYPEHTKPEADSGENACLSRSITFSPSQRVVAAELCGLVMVWSDSYRGPYAPQPPADWVTGWQGRRSAEPLLAFEHPVGLGMAFTADSRRLTTVGVGEIRMTDVSALAQPTAVTLDRLASSAAFSPDARTAAVMGDGRLRLLDVTSGRTIKTLTGAWISPRPAGLIDLEPWPPLRFSEDGRSLLANGEGAQVVLLDPATGRISRRFRSPHLKAGRGEVLAADLTPDGGQVAVVSTSEFGPESLAVWNARTGEKIRSATDHVLVTGLAFASDSKRLITSHPDSGVCVAAQPCDDGYRMPGRMSRLLGMSPGRRTAVLAFTDGSVSQWNPETRQLTGPLLPGHQGSETTSFAFSRDGKWLATGGEDDTVRLWDLSSGDAVGLPFRHNGDVLAVAFSADGSTLHVIDASAGLNSYALDMGELGAAVCVKAGRALTEQDRLRQIPDMPSVPASC